MKPGDVEAALRAALAPLGVHVGTRVPNPRPASHVRVTRAGGSWWQNLVQERPLMLIECWAPTSSSAFALAADVWGLINDLDMTESAGVWLSSGEPSPPINFPDPDAPGSARYQFTASILANLKENT